MQLDATIRTESTLIVLFIVEELEVVDDVLDELVELLAFTSPEISTL